MRALVVVDLEFSSTHLFTAVNEKNSKWKCFIAVDIATLLYGSGGSGLFWSLPKFPDLSGALVMYPSFELDSYRSMISRSATSYALQLIARVPVVVSIALIYPFSTKEVLAIER